MPMSTDASELPPPGARDLWLALTASQLGAAHQATGLPNQDAVTARQIPPDVLVAAVADGHGHRRHFRSARGSQLAVTVACQAAQDLAARLDGFQTAAPIESEVLGTLVPAITGDWRDAVRENVAADPFTSREEASRGGDDPLIAYGSTLLLAIAGRRWLVLVQIGDGDIMGIQPDGRPLLPVPRDPSLDGQQTTSLCGARAEDEFRAAVVDTSTTPLLGVMLATDGYGNAQVADPWTDAVSADLAELINDRPPEWLAGQLPLWASRCASADGSADDTTIALLIAPSATGWRHDVPDEPAADEATTAARRLAEPTTSRRLTDPAADRSRRLMVIAAAAVVIAAVAAFLAIQLSSSPGTTPIPRTTPTSCSSPSATAGQHATASATATARPHAGAVSNPCRGGRAGG
ncbi:MAG TPA: protein phosphatase 2C domain-containing protein [Streptosporangiaceae bacterium]|nr:protein phosphatase 2C domain-containing protein [Streptosporangiaceae bacterium]